MKEKYPDPPRPELLPPKVTHTLGKFSWKLVTGTLKSRHYRWSFPDTDRQNMAKLDQQLSQGSAIAIGYHPGKVDAILYPLFINAYLDHLNRALGPIAAYQFFKRPAFVWSHFASTFLRSHLLPVVRENNNDDTPYQSNRMLYRNNLFNATSTHLNQPGFIYAVAPGQTREQSLSNDINLSFIKINRAYQYSIPYVAMAMFFDNQELITRVSEPVYLHEHPVPKNQDATNFYASVVMRSLAGLLPEDRRGPHQ
jgi:hypothetical protein